MDIKSARDQLIDIIKNAGSGIVTVISYDDAGEKIATGTGFLITDNGRIVTNAHVLRNAYSAEVISNKNVYSSVSFIHSDDELDISLIKIDAADESTIAMNPDFRFTSGDKVYIVGKTDSSEYSFSEGIVQGILHKENLPDFIKIKKTVSILSLPESTGGPVLDTQGKLIGLTRSHISDHPLWKETISFASDNEFHVVSLKQILNLVPESVETTPLKPARSFIWTSKIKKKVVSLATSAFVILYTTGFTKIMAVLIGTVIIISFIQWLFLKIKKKMQSG